MKQRVSESLLDDCPGVSENRKLLLLRHFGSIERLRHATAEEISSIEGIGRKLAGTLVDFFSKLKRRPQVEKEIVDDSSRPAESEPGVVTYQLKPTDHQPQTNQKELLSSDPF